MGNTSLRTFLNQPYGLFESKTNRLILSFGISCFVWFILFSFGIFDLSYFSVWQRFYITGVYSLFELLSLLLNLFVIYKYAVTKATYSTSALWILWLIFCIGLSNFFVTTKIFGFEDFTWYVFIKNQIYTLILGLIIIPFGLMIHYNFILKQKILQIETTNGEATKVEQTISENVKVLLQSEYNSDSIEISLNRILFIKSADNYIDVYYLNEGKVTHKFIRNTLTAVEQMCVHPDLVRCHRSYIVNKRKILSIDGNKYGYILHLDGYDQKIPLSRKLKQDFVVSLK
jgi:hypothetical protein